MPAELGRPSTENRPRREQPRPRVTESLTSFGTPVLDKELSLFFYGGASTETTTKEKLVRVEELAPNPRREEKKTEKGCVVRSLASALQAGPEEGEWERRFKQMEQPGTYDQALADPFLSERQKEELGKAARDEADKQVVDLIREYAKNDSALGASLRNKNIEEHGKLDQEGIHTLIDSGREVTIIGKVEGGSRHMVHVTRNKAGELIAKSDDGKNPIDLNGEYTTIAFAQKTAKAVELPIRRETGDTHETIVYKKAA